MYWTERGADGRGRLMRCHLDGSDVTTIIGHRRRQSRSASSSSSSSSCSCPEMSVASPSAVDHTHPAPALIYVADSDSGDIWSLLMDDDACHCRLVVNASAPSLAPSHSGQSTTTTALATLINKSVVRFTWVTNLVRHTGMNELRKLSDIL